MFQHFLKTFYQGIRCIWTCIKKIFVSEVSTIVDNGHHPYSVLRAIMTEGGHDDAIKNTVEVAAKIAVCTQTPKHFSSEGSRDD